VKGKSAMAASVQTLK